MPQPLSRLVENALFDAIEELVAGYARRHRRVPINVSHWDPSKDFVSKLRAKIPIPAEIDPVPYRYSYQIVSKNAALEKLGFKSPTSGLFTENGSASISAIANCLQHLRIKEVQLFSPAYFTTSHSLERLGITVRRIQIPRRRDQYHWPANVKIGENRAIWITNPIYNTGTYFVDAQISEIKRALKSGTVVIADETLAITPTELAHCCSGSRNYVGIYTPHKGICINGQKFSIVVFHPDFEDFFDDWADVLSGGLSISACAAIKHFMTPDFDNYKEEFLHALEEARSWHDSLVSKYSGLISVDKECRGHFLTVYFNSLDAKLGESLSFLERIIEASGTSFIPGNRSGFDRSAGFCFRVNLAQDSKQFRGALVRLYQALAG